MRFYDSSWGEIHPKSSKLIPNTDSWNTPLNWYTQVICWDAPSQIEGFPWQASSRAETPTLLWPKRRIEGGCSTSKTLACPEKMHHKSIYHQGYAERKKTSQECEIPRDK